VAAGKSDSGRSFRRANSHVHADQSLHTALGRMGAAGLDVLPVVSRANVRQPLGIVTVDDVLALYGVRPR
jgi:CBS domain-containing protein